MDEKDIYRIGAHLLAVAITVHIVISPITLNFIFPEYEYGPVIGTEDSFFGSPIDVYAYKRLIGRGTFWGTFGPILLTAALTFTFLCLYKTNKIRGLCTTVVVLSCMWIPKLFKLDALEPIVLIPLVGVGLLLLFIIWVPYLWKKAEK